MLPWTPGTSFLASRSGSSRPLRTRPTAPDGILMKGANPPPVTPGGHKPLFDFRFAKAPGPAGRLMPTSLRSTSTGTGPRAASAQAAASSNTSSPQKMGFLRMNGRIMPLYPHRGPFLRMATPSSADLIGGSPFPGAENPSYAPGEPFFSTPGASEAFSAPGNLKERLQHKIKGAASA